MHLLRSAPQQADTGPPSPSSGLHGPFASLVFTAQVLDAGHAAAALSLAAAAHGWRCEVLRHPELFAATATIAQLAGLRGAHAGWEHVPAVEREEPMLALVITRPAAAHGHPPPPTAAQLRAVGRALQWHGRPSVLSPQGGQVGYAALTRVAIATSGAGLQQPDSPTAAPFPCHARR